MTGAPRHPLEHHFPKILVTLILILLLETALAEVIVVQAQLVDDQGQPWSGLVPIEFSIHDHPADGSRLWVEEQDVEVLDGLFSATLGVVVSLSEGLFATPDRWLGISVEGMGEQAERFRLSGSPIAIHAGLVETLAPGSVDGGQLERGALTPAKLEACNVGDIIVMGAHGWVCKTPGDQQ